MTLAQMAEYLGLKDSTPLRRLCESGKLQAEKMGKTWLVPNDEVERYRRESLGKRGRRPRDSAMGSE
jgi:excisionase family DNA binding protein